MTPFVVWVDADSCPKEIRAFLAAAADRSAFSVRFVSNRELGISESDFVESIVCEQSKDAADNHIFKNARGLDIVVTRDVLFASRLVEEGICALNDRGFSFTKDNIKERLMERDFSMNLAEIGFGPKSKKSQYGKKEFERFKRRFAEKLSARGVAIS